MKAGKKILLVTGALAFTGLMYGCGTEEPPLVVTTFNGVVQEGPISNAVVYLDLNGNGIFDGNEPSATTGPTGAYTMHVTQAQAAQITANTRLRVLFSAATIDTTTNQAPIPTPLASPVPSGLGTVANAAATNVTPITTLVAFTPAAQQTALKTKLAAIGVTDPNAPISSASPAAVALAKSVEVALAAINTSVSTVNPDAAARLTQTAAADIGSAIATGAQNLATPAGLAATISSGVGAAITTPPAGVFTTAPNLVAVQTAISNAVTTVATNIQTAAGGALSTTAQANSEATLMGSDAVAANIATANNNAVAGLEAAGGEIAPPTAEAVPPTLISSTGATLTSSSTLNASIIPATITVSASEALNPETVNVNTVQVKQGATPVAANVSYNPATRVITITPVAQLNAGTSYAITFTNGIKDLSGNSLTTVTLTLTIAPGVTGATGGTGGSTSGTGINF